MLDRGYHDSDDLARRGVVEPVDAVARHDAGRQVKQHVDRARESQFLERLGDGRADALQRGDLGEQRVEQVGPHG